MASSGGVFKAGMYIYKTTVKTFNNEFIRISKNVLILINCGKYIDIK